MWLEKYTVGHGQPYAMLHSTLAQTIILQSLNGIRATVIEKSDAYGTMQIEQR